MSLELHTADRSPDGRLVEPPPAQHGARVVGAAPEPKTRRTIHLEDRDPGGRGVHGLLEWEEQGDPGS